MSTVLTAPVHRDTRSPEEPGPRSWMRRSLIAFTACVLSVLALTAVLRTGSWLPRSLIMVTESMALGGLGRAVRLPRPVIVGAQTLVALFVIVAFQTSGDARWGFLPGWDALRRLGRQWDDGLGDLTRLRPPDHPSVGITTVVLIAVAVAAITVDALAASYRRPDLAAWVIPTLYVVPAFALPRSWREAMFLLPAVGYLLLLLEGTSDRASRWGEQTVVARGGGRRMTASAGVAVLTLSVAIPSALPAVTGSVFQNSGIGRHDAAPLKVLDPLQVMRDLLTTAVDVPMFDHRTDSPWPDEEYLESAILDSFDGSQWRGATREVHPFNGNLPAPIGIAPSIPAAAVASALQARPGIESDFVPMARPATHLTIGGKWRLDADSGDVLSFAGRRQIASKAWSVVGLVLDPDRSALSGAAPKDAALARYLALPSLPPQIAAQARAITAGAPSAVEAGFKLQEFFRDPARFTYDMHPYGSGIAAITAYLTTRHGYAEQAAATMAVMARTLGIPARVAVGFTAGQSGAPASRTVSAHDAHAWPELFLPDVGWTRFEPTPAGASSAPRPLHWLLAAKKSAPEAAKKHERQPPPPQEQPQSAPPPPPAQSAGGQDSCAADPGNCTHKLQPSAAGNDHRVLLTLLVALGLLLLGSPRITHTVIRRHRWAAIAHGSTEAWRRSPQGAVRIARVAWLELRDTAVDLGHRWPAARTPQQAGQALAADVRLTAAAAHSLAAVVGTVERLRYAPHTGGRVDHARLRTELVVLRRELARQCSRWTRLRAWLLPPSLGLVVKQAVARVRAPGRAVARPIARRARART